jgi:hypothetical protein
MVDVVFVDVLHAKIVDNKGEAHGVPVMMPVSWCDSALAVSCFVKAFDEEFLHNYASLWEAIHSLLYLAARGKQVFGMNYYETDAPVMTWFLTRLLIVIGIIFGWALCQVDYIMAYPQASIECDMYMELPQ